MNKQNFLSFVYDSLVNDILGAVDTILYDYEPLHSTELYESFRDVALSLRKRPDIFRNLVFLSRFVFMSLDFDSAVYRSLAYSQKVSPMWLSNLLIFKNFFDECKKDN